MTAARVLRALVVVALWGVALALCGVVAVRLLDLEEGTIASFLMAALPALLAASYPLLLAAVLLRRRVLSVLALALTATHVLLVMPSTGSSEQACDGTPLRVVGANVLKSNPVPERAAATLRDLHPDVLVLPELTDPLVAAFATTGLAAELPYRLDDGKANFDRTGIRSRYPLSLPRLHEITYAFEPRAVIQVGGVLVRLLGVHPQPPLDGQSAGWVAALQDLGRELQEQPVAAIAAGDFNGGRDFASFRDLLTGGVRDAHEEVGRGLAATWPAGRSVPPVLHLDHVLVRSAGTGVIAVCDVREVEVPGSDHLAVVADLAVRRDDRPRG